jgi:pimeloyl-ACP methyl ester carboxylesterase
MAWLGFILTIGSVGLLLAAAVVFLMARALLSPPRMTDGKALYVLGRLGPSDLGLESQEVSFKVRDARTGGSLLIAGWWIPRASSRQTVVLIHGYSDAKVGAIAWAPMWHALGWNILAVDLRAHGHSGGTQTTAGFFEREDMDQILCQARARWPQQTRAVVLFGVSLGAAVAAAVAAGRDDLDGVILESCFADYRHAVRAHGEQLGMPLPSLQPLAVRIAEWMSGADFRAVRPVDAVERIACPLLLIFSRPDPFVPESDMIALEQAARARPGAHTAVYTVEGANHCMGIAADAQAYQRTIAEFLTACCPSVPAGVDPVARG